MRANHRRDLYAKISSILTSVILLIPSGYVPAADVFSDNCESGTVSIWQVVGGTFAVQSFIVRNGTEAHAAGLQANNDLYASYSIPSAQTGASSVLTEKINSGNVYMDNLEVTASVNNAAGVISTVAGNGTRGYSGDGGPATSAELSFPYDVVVDKMGNLFIADMSNARIRKVTPGGVISTVAGTGIAGYSGDGGLATAAQFYAPSGVAVDTAGNLFIADTYNNCVRKVTSGGVISTVAGNGSAGYSGDGGPATSAQLNHPNDMTVDTAGNIFIADTINDRIRKVTPGGIISTVAGGGNQGLGDGGPATSAALSYPMAVAVDATGNLFISDMVYDRIRKVSPGGSISTIAGNGTYGFSGDGGPATSAMIGHPSGVAVDTAGNVFFTDLDINRIRKVTPDGTINTVVGSGKTDYSGDGGPATSAGLCSPYGVAVDTAGNIFIADTRNYVIRKVAVASNISIFAQVADGGGYSTTFSLLNNQSTAIKGQLNFFNTDGTPRSLTINGVTGTQFSVNLPVDGSLYMTTSNTGPTTSGWAILNSDLPVQSVATFDYRNAKGTLTTTAAVLGSGAATKVALPVETSASLDTGVAIVNFGSSAISVRLRLLDETGSEIANELNLVDTQKQLVGFVSQFFSTVQGIANFKGVLTAEVEGQGSFAATSLILKEGMYSALPVVVIK